MAAFEALERVKRAVRETRESGRYEGARYRVPRRWTGDAGGVQEVDPFEWILEAIEKIERSEPRVEEAEHPVIYNLFVRAALAYDHDGDGELGGASQDITLNRDGLRETGTFLKAIPFLFHLKRLGTDTLYLLPITAVARWGNKGDLGSPYAIRNPYRLDERLADPLAAGTDAETQFRALCEAARALGMKVVVEFVFRTASRDSEWIEEHPDWFYWIRADFPDRKAGDPPEKGYGPPPFTEEELKQIKEAAVLDESGVLCPPEELRRRLEEGRGRLVEPPEWYRRLFTGPPAPETIERTDEGMVLAVSPDGTRIRIPGAFADWPPDDIQPPWNDVTYLRMYRDPEDRFNYIAYNTIRVYDPRLARRENRVSDLWEKIAGIVLHYRKTYEIDGVMIDMGHALPGELVSEIKSRVLEEAPRFFFWEENFTMTAKSVEDGYSAVVGPAFLSFSSAESIAGFLRSIADGVPIRFFGTPENHNSPRCAARRPGGRWNEVCWGLLCFLPQAIPFIHNGFEIEERAPLNTGLGFSEEDLEKLEGEPLGLFDRVSFGWEREEAGLCEFIRRTLELRRIYLKPVGPDESRLLFPQELPSNVVSYLVEARNGWLYAAANIDPSDGAAIRWENVVAGIPSGHPSASDRRPRELLANEIHEGEEVVLPPMTFRIFHLGG